jgi:parallel beta-helix repeat protein
VKPLHSNRLFSAVSLASFMFFFFALAIARSSDAATIHVPADQPTIQQAINAAVSGDTVLVAPGTYLEMIDFVGKIITVTSELGPATTIIDAGRAGSVVTFRSGETRHAILSGFTIRGGQNIYSGAGISVSFSSPTIRGNIISENHGCSGVGIDSYFSSPRIEENTISRNTIYGCTGGWGIGIYIGGNSAAEIIGNMISDNTGEAASGGGIALFAAGNALVIGNVIARNATAGPAGCGWGGAVAIANFVQAKIVNNLIVGNRACYGGAFHWYGSSGETVLLNNTIADNEASVNWPGIYAAGVDSRNQMSNNIITARYGPALFCENAMSSTPPVLDSNDLFNAAGSSYGGTCADPTGMNGNISANPLFIDAAAGDYRVGFSSPVVDAGNNSAPDIQLTDIAGNPRVAGPTGGPYRIDMGAYEYINPAPTADAGADQTVTAGANCLATVTLNGIGSDPDGDALTFTWTSSVGTFIGPTLTRSLPAGTYRFILTVSDGNGGSASDSVVITVLDATPPSIGALTASPNVLSPANHDFVPVVVSVSVSDMCGGAVSCRIVSVVSNEPIRGLGGNDTSPDWQITGDLTLNLRAERSNKGDGRVYTITVECTDVSGNSSTSTVTVMVPRR